MSEREATDLHHTPPFGPFGGPGGQRMRRGMLEKFILRALIEKPMHGYELISFMTERSRGSWRPSAGSIYPNLQALENKGLVASVDIAGKKTYTLTKQGVQKANKAEEVGEHIQERFQYNRSFTEGGDLSETMGLIMKDMRTILRHGTDQQRDDMREMVQKMRADLQAMVNTNTDS